MELNFERIIVGFASLLIIGAFHPLVIWCEYHFSYKIWPLFLLCGLVCIVFALFVEGILSTLFGLLGAAFLWSIRELIEQAHRVEREWFPKKHKRSQSFFDSLEEESDSQPLAQLFLPKIRNTRKAYLYEFLPHKKLYTLISNASYTSNEVNTDCFTKRSGKGLEPQRQ